MDSVWLILLVLGVMVARLAAVWTKGLRARKAAEAGMAALQRGDYAAAENAFRRGVNLSPIWAAGRRALAHCLTAQQKFGDAEEQIRFAAQLEPRNSEGHLELAIFLAKCPPQRPSEALDALEKAVEYQPALAMRLPYLEYFQSLRDEPRFQALAARATRADASLDTPA